MAFFIVVFIVLVIFCGGSSRSFGRRRRGTYSRTRQQAASMSRGKPTYVGTTIRTDQWVKRWRW